MRQDFMALRQVLIYNLVRSCKMVEITYTETTTDKGIVIIIRDNGDGTTSSFQADPANSDYQAYLKSLENAD